MRYSWSLASYHGFMVSFDGLDEILSVQENQLKLGLSNKVQICEISH